MKGRLHLFAFLLFFLALLYDLVVWGAVPALDDVGESIAVSARREAPLAATYIALGAPLDALAPPLQSFGKQRLTEAWGQGFERMLGDRSVAMDVVFGDTWNGQHRWIKLMYWAPPPLLALALVLWLRRSRQVRALARR